MAVTIAADRSAEGRDTEPAAYAREVVAALPGFEGGVSVQDAQVAGSPYETADRRGVRDGEDERRARSG